jgi:hypothetical protein
VAEDPAGMAAIMVAQEGIIAGVVDIVGIMAGMVDIMVEAISTEAHASTSVDTLGTPTTIRTGIILTPIITLPLITIPINRMPFPSPSPMPNWSKTLMGTNCQASQGVHPYVKSCPGGWTRVVPTPPQSGKERR